ncbi:U3 snoRNP protein [Tilletia horrida]|nr:U3 snoRNP protein [Tilletia horrida]
MGSKRKAQDGSGGASNSRPRGGGGGGGGGGRPRLSVDALQQQEDDLVASLFGGISNSNKRAKTSGAAVNSSKKGKKAEAGADEEDEEGEGAESDDPWTGLEHVENDQLFSIDAAGASEDEEDDDNSSEIEYEAEEYDAEATDAEEEEDEEEDEDARGRATSKQLSTARRRSAWTDPDDAQLVVALAGANARAADGSFVGTKRLRKLRQHADETEVNGLEYEARLRKIFEKLHPRPAWAARSKKTDVDYSVAAPPASKDTLLLSDLLSRDSGLVARATGTGASSTRGRLQPDSLEVERLRNANEAQGRDDDAAIESLGFHPTSNANILMSATRNRKIRLFQIDGKANPLLHTISLPDLTLQTALFHPLGTTAFFAGARPFFYTHDFITGNTTRSLPWRGSVDGAYDGSEAERDLSFARFQPLHGVGNLLAIGGKRGTVHLLDWGNSANSTSGTSGRGSLVGSLRMNAPLVGMAWDPSDSVGGRRLVTLSKEGRAHVWDVRNMRCEAARVDLGLYAPKGLEVSPTAILPADASTGTGVSHAWIVGSDSGIVSVYDDKFAAVETAGADMSGSTSVGSGTGAKVVEAPASFTSRETMSSRKTVENLTTAITTMRFNHDGQVCAVASRNKKDALKMVHTSTLRIFPNWPTSGTPLHHVTALDFSRRGEYAAIGNSKGRVLLYELKHYAS